MAIKLENYDKGIEELIKIVNTLEKEQLKKVLSCIKRE